MDAEDSVPDADYHTFYIDENPKVRAEHKNRKRLGEYIWTVDLPRHAMTLQGPSVLMTSRCNIR